MNVFGQSTRPRRRDDARPVRNRDGSVLALVIVVGVLMAAACLMGVAVAAGLTD